MQTWVFFWDVSADDDSSKSTLLSAADLDTEGNVQLQLDGGKLHLTVAGNGGIIFTWAPATMSWYFLSLSYSVNEQEVKLYVDGVLQETATQASIAVLLPATTVGALVGDEGVAQDFAQMHVASLTLWSTVVDGTDCVDDDTIDEGVLVWYDFAADGNTVVDQTGNGNGALLVDVTHSTKDHNAVSAVSCASGTEGDDDGVAVVVSSTLSLAAWPGTTAASWAHTSPS